MNRNKTIHVGSISHGTLRIEDLLEAFADELERIATTRDKASRKLVRDARRIDPDHEDAGEIVLKMQDRLNDLCPPYITFGTLEGDGSDFGFWPSIDSMEEDARYGELLKVGDLGEVPRGHRGLVMQVSDHGNVTLYCVDARGAAREIWSCV